MTKKTSKNKKSVRNTLSSAPKRTLLSMLTGGVVSSDFFYKHKLKIFVFLILVMFYISTKYQCLTGMETIKRLENELEVVKTESIRERSEYMSRVRESAMAELADSICPGLSVQPQPPYELQLSNSTK